MDPFESMLYRRIDGKRPIIEVLVDDALDDANALQHVTEARAFFRRMAEWDHLLYEIP